jgi:hypothetical protein
MQIALGTFSLLVLQDGRSQVEMMLRKKCIIISFSLGKTLLTSPPTRPNEVLPNRKVFGVHGKSDGYLLFFHDTILPLFLLSR